MPAAPLRTLVVTPTYLEAENIVEFLQRLRAAVPAADVLVVDDNSPDGTADLAEKVGAELGSIEVLRRPSKKGLGNAYRAGFAVGLDREYEVLVQIDADLSHDPAALPRLLAALDEGADLAVGSRYVPGGAIPHWPLHRRALSRYGNRYAAFALKLQVHDATSGYRAYRSHVLRGVQVADTRANGYLFQIELAYRVSKWGGKIAERPITFTDRIRGTSKMSGAIIAEEMIFVTWWGIQERVRDLRARRDRRRATPAAP